jgi:hypothetical protein
MADDATPNLETLRRLNDAGYGFYRNPARVRADDLLVRARAANYLHRAAAALSRAEQALRHAMPAPSRENPFPDPALLATARALKAFQDRIAIFETRLRGPAALPDRDFSAVIPTEDLRQRLVTLDAALLDRAAIAEAEASAAAHAAYESVLDAFEQAIRERTELTAGSGRPV